MPNNIIALVTSTLIPADSSYSYFSPEDRIAQTLHTVERLKAVGFKEIYLFDNSLKNVDEKLALFTGVKSFHTPQYNFNNKGHNEALLILNNIHNLPGDTPLFKISGRYYPTDDFKVIETRLLNKHEFIGIGIDFNKKISGFNTRAYFVQNKKVLEDTLVLAIEEMMGYPRGIHGPKSFLKALSALFKQTHGTEYQLSIEQALALILKSRQNYLIIKKMNIAGHIAGSDFLELTED